MATRSGLTIRTYVELGTSAQPVLVRWSTWGTRHGNYDSYAVILPEGPVLIDPVDPLAESGGELWPLLGRPPQATVLTNDYHERDAYVIRERWGTPVWAPAAGLPARGGELEGQPDHLYEDGQTLPGGLRAIKIAGKFAGDTVLAWQAPTGERVLFTGDAINGEFNPDNPLVHPRRGAPGLYLGAGPFYLRDLDVEALKASLRPILSGRVDLLCGAHGQPVRENAGAALARLVELDWTPFLQEGRHPVVPVAR